MSDFKSDIRSKLIWVGVINATGWALVLTFLWTLIGAFEIYRELLFTGNHIYLGLQSHLHSDHEDSLNRHLESFSKLMRKEDFIEPNTILVVNQLGDVTGSSVKAWQSLNMQDLISIKGIFSNKKIKDFSNCVLKKDKCEPALFLGSHFSLKLPTTITSMRVLKINSMNSITGLGMPVKKAYLIVVWDGIEAVSELTNIVFIGFLLIAIIMVLVQVVPTAYASNFLLPLIYNSLQKDHLTKLNNRSIFTEQALLKLEKAEVEQHPYVFVIVDIDDFKKINDAFGHLAGDITLAEYGLVIGQAIQRSSDISSRFGGEEFALLIQSDRKNCTTMLERLRLQIEIHDVRYEGTSISTTISLGAASTEECGYNFDYLLMKADEALYHAKREGKNQVQWHESSVITLNNKI